MCLQLWFSQACNTYFKIIYLSYKHHVSDYYIHIYLKRERCTSFMHVFLCIYVILSHSVVSISLWPHGLWPHSPPGSSLYGISQVRILERVAISFSREPSPLRDQTRVSYTGRWILDHWATREAPSTKGMSLTAQAVCCVYSPRASLGGPVSPRSVHWRHD